MIENIVEQHKDLGQAVTKLIVDYVRTLDTRRVTPAAKPADLSALFAEPLPEKGTSFAKILERFRNDIAPNCMQVPSPRYYGQFNPTPLPVGVWADALCSM